MESIRIPIDESWGIVESVSDNQKAWGYRFYPDQVKGEGLFAACLKKREPEKQFYYSKSKENQKLPAKELELVKNYIQQPDDFCFFKVADTWMAIYKDHKPTVELLQKYVYLKKSG